MNEPPSCPKRARSLRTPSAPGFSPLYLFVSPHRHTSKMFITPSPLCIAEALI